MSKPKVLDLFSGAGGFSLGFELAGCEIIGAIEHDKWAADTFRYNHVRTKMLLGDIELFDNNYIKQEIPTPDMIIGGPPCQGFSVCLKNAGDPKDRVILCLLNMCVLRSFMSLRYLFLKMYQI